MPPMPPMLRHGSYELDLAELYVHMWNLGASDRGDATRLYRPRPGRSLKWLVAELSGAPAAKHQASVANSSLRQTASAVLLEWGWVEQVNERSFRLLRPPDEAKVGWPTIEWVKAPVSLSTGQPSGAAIRMRHFLDCKHWYRDSSGVDVLGEKPRLASDGEMRELPACATCVSRAERASHPSWGQRLEDDAEEDSHWAGLVLDMPTDVLAVRANRREQIFLRNRLLGDSAVAQCGLCGRSLPSTILVAAHIVPRRFLSDAERLDFASAAMLACLLGCDSLFERGYIVVDERGSVSGNRSPETIAMRDALSVVVGRTAGAFRPETAPRFAEHLRRHRAGDLM